MLLNAGGIVHRRGTHTGEPDPKSAKHWVNIVACGYVGDKIDVTPGDQPTPGPFAALPACT